MRWNQSLELFFVIYFCFINGTYLFFLIIGSFQNYKRFRQVEEENDPILLKSNSLPEILFVVPMHNEEEKIISNLFNIMSLTYRYKKVIAVNDGSTDDTLGLVIRSFEFIPVPKTYVDELPTQAVRGVYQSKKHPEIILIDKENGGKADAVNAAINAVPTPFFVVLDADTVLDNTGFEKLIRPILVQPETIAVGACIRLINGCSVEYNRVMTKTFPNEFFPAMQALEYLRSFFLRDGFNVVNSNYIVSGAFGIFPRNLVVQIGGYAKSIGEDAEISVRLHRAMHLAKRKYRIQYLPDPIAWTVGPSKYYPLHKQRVRWHRGVLETIWIHKRVLLNPWYGAFGMLGLPFFLIGEALEPLVEIAAWAYIGYTYYVGILDLEFLYLILAISFGFTILYSMICLFIEEATFRKYPSLRSLTVLFFCNFIENIGYRQMTLLWRLLGFWDFFLHLGSLRKETKKVNEQLHSFSKSVSEGAPLKSPTPHDL